MPVEHSQSHKLIQTIGDAILAINPDAVFSTSASTIDADVKDATITWLENTPEISNTEIQNKLDALRSQALIDQENKEIKKASGRQKLKDLGLDDDEINALIGV